MYVMLQPPRPIMQYISSHMRGSSFETSESTVKRKLIKKLVLNKKIEAIEIH